MKPYMQQLIANNALRERLCSDILGGTLSHAYIIEGVKGSGRHTVAKLTSAALSCEKKSDPSLPLPCSECPSCRKILKELSPDVITVGCDGKATMGVDSIRFLREDVYVVPNELDNKVYIIEDADKMTVQAQNAFLLTLEEPPSYAVFFLLCENAGSLLETIRSRAPILRTEPIDIELIDEYISSNDRRAAQMKLSSPSDYAQLLMSSQNGIGRALELLEPKALSPILEKRALAKDFVTAAIEKRSREDALALTLRFSSKRDKLSEELMLIHTAVRDLVLTKKSDNAPLCFYENRDAAIELCEKSTMSELIRLFKTVSEALERISRNANVRLTVTALLADAEML